MDVEAVMEEIAVALRTIPSLAGRTFGYPPDAAEPPAAIVGYPEGQFDQTYVRGMDRWTVPVHILVSRVDDRAGRALLSPYVSGSGVSSAKTAIDGGVYAACDFAVVNDFSVKVVTLGGDDYLAAEFAVDVAGSGE